MLSINDRVAVIGMFGIPVQTGIIVDTKEADVCSAAYAVRFDDRPPGDTIVDWWVEATEVYLESEFTAATSSPQMDRRGGHPTNHTEANQMKYVIETMQEAFTKVCSEAKKPEGCYVSLYCDRPFFGGHEEGGWWGSDTTLVAYQWYPTAEAAEAAVVSVKKYAEQKTAEAKRAYGEQCTRELEWLDERGLDSDALPEVNGEETFWVTNEVLPGSHESQGNRRYE